jgi:hypothetical protein
MRPIEDELINQVVDLGREIRRQRAEGNLQSLVPPTIYGYLAFFRVVRAIDHLSLKQVAQCTLLGNASPEDQGHAASLFNNVFGLARPEEDDPAQTGHLI